MKRNPKTPRPKAKKKSKEIVTAAFRGSDLGAVIVLVLSLVMIGGISVSGQIHGESDLRVIQARIDEFMILHGSTPRSSAELKAYLKSEGFGFDWYGTDGSPTEFIRIGSEYYLLQRPVTGELSELDYVPAVYRLPKILSSTLRQNFSKEKLGFYPAAILLGTNSPDDQYHARILIDHESSRRFLVVTNNTRIDRAWVAPHEFVEEFFWTSDANRIVYSATSSSRYDDGIYLWQPQSNEQRNLLRDKKSTSNAMVGTNDGSRSLALVGISDQEVFFVDQPHQHGFSLPQDFYHPKMIERAAIEKGAPLQKIANQSPETLGFINDRLNSQLSWQFEPQMSQTEHARLLRLTIDSDLNEAINRWQSYCQEQKRSVVYPYCLWVLENLYLKLADSWESDTQEYAIARAYALEFAKAIAESAEAPQYLRRLAQNGVDALLAGLELSPEFGPLK